MSETHIHPTAVVEPGARLGRGVRVGPFCYVAADVELGDGCLLHPHVTLLGPSTFGARNQFFPQATRGGPPQDLKYRGGPTPLVVGDDNVFRESVTVHRGTEVDASGGVTRIGSNNLLMVGVHVAHDVEVGNHCILANCVQLAGHVCIEDRVVVGGHSAMHHFVTVGRYAYIAGMTRITHDVPPYLKVAGYDQKVRGPNSLGMGRWQIPEPSIRGVRAAWRMLYARRRPAAPAIQVLGEIESNGLMGDDHVRYLVEFLRRKLAAGGALGRVREARRADSDADRRKFYRTTDSEDERGST